ncbi:microtubule-associated protein, RP/EB family [Trypanosoma conorhini]|uniref:Microtubule-associated protein, RP/EB family n=1 Tax=Trypanosoma conorhini TaxID=83891 RepID=A0A422NTM9_9TRYP|nr:microtubule-associated protein, RP/EB family [Trypanosoma conorhini]RNF08764.1 microtubule-associated protein, RP/EB family [Trypanosoma conorhini]
MDRGRVTPSLRVVASKDSRTELLAWLNELLDNNAAAAGGQPLPRLHKVEQCSNGVPYVLLLPSLLATPYPPLTAKAKTNAKHEFDAVVNMKLFMDALHKNGIPRPEVLSKDLDKVIKGAYQANLQLLQWFRGLYDALSASPAERTQRRTSLGEPADPDAAAPSRPAEGAPPPNDCEGPHAEAETAARAAVLSGRVPSAQPASRASAASHPAHSQEASAQPASATAKRSSSFHGSGNALVARPSSAYRRQVAPGRGHVSPARGYSAARREVARDRTPSTSSRGAGEAARAARPASSLLRSGNSTKRFEGGRDPELGPGGKAPGTGSTAARPATAVSLRNMAATSLTTTTTTAARAPLERSGARPLVDCSSTDLNAPPGSPMGGPKRTSTLRRGADSLATSASQAGPAGLFHSSRVGTPVHSFRHSRSLSGGGSNGDPSMSAALAAVKNERQFYYDKLRLIENLVGPVAEQNEGSPETKHLARSVLEILYAAA